MDHQDMEKAKRLFGKLNDVLGTSTPFPEAEIAHVMNVLAQHMEDEDPEQMIPCCCHGTYWPAKDVDFWGLCPDSRPR